MEHEKIIILNGDKSKICSIRKDFEFEVIGNGIFCRSYSDKPLCEYENSEEARADLKALFNTIKAGNKYFAFNWQDNDFDIEAELKRIEDENTHEDATSLREHLKQINMNGGIEHSTAIKNSFIIS